MKRKILIAVLALGTVGGFASGFASMRRWHHHRKSAWKDHVTDICADAMRKADRDGRDRHRDRHRED